MALIAKEEYELPCWNWIFGITEVNEELNMRSGSLKWRRRMICVGEEIKWAYDYMKWSQNMVEIHEFVKFVVWFSQNSCITVKDMVTMNKVLL